MRYWQLGTSGPTVSVLALGCGSFGVRCDPAQTRAVVGAAIDAGITLFDTADVEGDRGGAEALLGAALKGRRDQVVIATKFGGDMGGPDQGPRGSKRYIRTAVEASLRRLQTDYVDLYQQHYPDNSMPREETLAAMFRLVKEGKVRYLGSCNYEAWQVAEADSFALGFGMARPVSTQSCYSLLHRVAEAELLPTCERFGISVLAYAPLAHGLLTGRYRRGEPIAAGIRLHGRQHLFTPQVFDREDLARPVILTGGQLFGGALLRLAERRWIWYQRYHQIVMDGLGWSLFSRRVAELYTAISAGVTPPPRRFDSLRAVVEEEAAYRRSERYVHDRDYWLARVLDDSGQPALPLVPAASQRARLRSTLELPAEAVDQLAGAARRTGTGISRYLVALLATYLFRVTGQAELVLSVPLSGRVDRAARHTPCKLSNVLPLLLAPTPEVRLSDFARQVSIELGAIVAHQRYRGEDLRRELKLAINQGRFFGPMVNVVRFDFDLWFGAVRGMVGNLSTGPVEDLSICVLDRRDGRDAG